ncbi:hypothetical protein PLICRDRAFT_89891 [Plicaturopsis crispa FD-325 SS-3]|nr:hypothetical protein PLICRDRAFT_89891 [Plicaturopsis crispa FD-325 SS-3]
MPPLVDAAKLREECPRFRILIVGRANAGKTTICQKMCNTTELPVVRNKDGDVIHIDPSGERGIHNIDDEITYEANPGFVFHDSRGFESGTVEELTLMNEFIKQRSEGTELRQRLHAIWYCLPLDDARPIQPVEINFFEHGTDPVPVILIFTKLDGLLIHAESEIREEADPSDDEVEDLTNIWTDTYVTKVEATIKATRHPPTAFVRLKNMHRPGANCGDLVEQTASSITDGRLQLLFVSVQTINIKICIEYAARQLVKKVSTINVTLCTHWSLVSLILLEHSFWCNGEDFNTPLQEAATHYKASSQPATIEKILAQKPLPWIGMDEEGQITWLFNFPRPEQLQA